MLFQENFFLFLKLGIFLSNGGCPLQLPLPNLLDVDSVRTLERKKRRISCGLQGKKRGLHRPDAKSLTQPIARPSVGPETHLPLRMLGLPDLQPVKPSRAPRTGYTIKIRSEVHEGYLPSQFQSLSRLPLPGTCRSGRLHLAEDPTTGKRDYLNGSTQHKQSGSLNLGTRPGNFLDDSACECRLGRVLVLTMVITDRAGKGTFQKSCEKDL